MPHHQKAPDTQLRLFLEIARDLSLTRTAERLNVSQPALSQNLKHLEETLGQRLMERDGRGLRLTSIGQELFHSLEGVFHYIDVSVSRLREQIGQSEGRISISCEGTLCSYFLPPIVREFSDSFQRVKLDIAVRESRDAIKLVMKGVSDIGLVYGTEVVDERLAVLHLFNESMVAVCPDELPVTATIRASGCLPHGTPVVVSPQGSSMRSMLDRAFKPGHLLVKAEVDAIDVALALAAEGLGVCVLPSGVTERALAPYGLEGIRLVAPVLMREACVIFRKDVEQAPIVNALAQRMRARSRGLDALALVARTEASARAGATEIPASSGAAVPGAIESGFPVS